MRQLVIADIYGLPDEIALIGHKEPGFFKSGERPAERRTYIVEIEVRRWVSAGELGGYKRTLTEDVLRLPGSQR